MPIIGAWRPEEEHRCDEPGFQIAVLPGDGIGQEVMAACLAVLGALERKVGGYRLVTETCRAAPALRHRHRVLGSELQTTEAADAILFGAMGLPEVRHRDRAHLELRREFELQRGPADQALSEREDAARRSRARARSTS